MWISKKKYERIMERLGDIERLASRVEYESNVKAIDHKGTRAEIAYLRDQFRVLVESLGLVHQQTPAKEAYVKKGGPEHG